MGKDIIKRDKCPMCDFQSSKSIFRRSFNEEIIRQYMNLNYFGHANTKFLEDTYFEIVKCTKCKGSYQKYVLGEDKLDELYNVWIDSKLAQEWNEDTSDEKRYFYCQIIGFAKNILNKESLKLRVLDYGAGFGDSLKVAAEMGFDSYAYEYSTERVQFLEEKGIKTIDKESQQTFEFIIVNNVLEHITYPAELLKNIYNKLNKSGLVFIAVPDCYNIEKKLVNANSIGDPKDLQMLLLNANINAFQHINFFTNSSLKVLLEKQNFKLLSPFKQAFTRPISIKSVLRPFYRYYKGTSFFLEKA